MKPNTIKGTVMMIVIEIAVCSAVMVEGEPWGLPGVISGFAVLLGVLVITVSEIGKKS